ncbi:MAG TPA: PIN domain-containing protein [Nitrososphaerales archaeon]|nr:PIN domain-containing protein [Nitrososphaerales archaeon]
MKIYVADAVALACYMEGDLPRLADRAFQEADQGEAHIIFPEIVVGEFIYTALKGRLRARDPSALISEMLEELETSANFEQASMTQQAWKEFLRSTVRELHDRMIHALAISRSVDAIITNDEEIRKTGFRTIW